MKTTFGRALGLALLAACLVPALTTDAGAIAAWARKYGATCTMCHSAGYKLNRTGQKFLREGHVVTGTEDKEQNLSDYLSLTAKIRTWRRPETTKTLATGAETTSKEHSSFETHALSLYTGGPLDKGFSYFSEFYLHENERKFVVTDPESTTLSDMGDWGRSKLAETYLQYRQSINDDFAWTARIGRIMPWLVHLHGGGARLEYNRPLAFSSTLGAMGLNAAATAPLADNPYRTFNRQYGASVGASFKDAFLELGVVNGTGKFENAHEVDNNKAKDFFAAVDYAFDDRGSMLGLYYYGGRYPVQQRRSAATTSFRSSDEFSQYGPIGNYTFEFGPAKGALVGAYLMGKNKYNTVFHTGGYEQKSTGYYAEAQAHLMDGNLAPYLRYDFFDVDTSFKNNEKSGPAIGLHWKPMDHGRFVLEYQSHKSKNAFREGTTGTVKAATTETTAKDLTLEIQFMF